MIEIRPAAAGETAALVDCHLACWREAYREYASEAYLANVSGGRSARISYWTTKIDNGRAPWLALDDGEVIGLADAGPTEDDDLRPGLELFMIYVRAAHWGAGVGHRLLEAAIGDQPASLWVLDGNDRAVGFYRRHGFRPDGARKLHPGFRRPIIRMIRGRS
ncbi:GNAT family N-acetyltransferase [Microlunatus parietis]|uniref:GNAT superfamily N-acetyltransferase n=1 Tax=Microlunatus parietis TaxID=682979 RepID=A0A7Y9IF30_9ACTN|nr:GNAT family N-acetyltransferase [Microlunatus parietis]NYE75353.1 GNAT superfamily N-acetyltransferase [Microlunatus parietis]